MDRHRLVPVGAIVTAVAAASVGIAVAQQSLTGPAEVGPPTLGSYAPKPSTPKVMAAAGSTSKGTYDVRVFTNDRGERCLELTQGHDVTGSCGHPPTAAHPIGTTLTDQLPGPAGDRLVVGVAAAGVGSVDAQSGGIHTAAPTQGRLDGGDRAFAVTLRSAPSQATMLTARDGAGEALAETAVRAAAG